MTESVKPRPFPLNPDYRVHVDGKIESRKYRGRQPQGKARPERWVQIRPRRHADGRLSFKPLLDGRHRQVYVHQAVLLTFVGPPPRGMICRQLDGNASNNRVENLRWGTYLENSQDAIRHGTQVRGSKHWNCRLSDEQVEAIRCERREEGATLHVLGERYVVSAVHAGRIVKGTRTSRKRLRSAA